MNKNRSYNEEMKTSTLHKGYKWVPGEKNIFGYPMQVEDHIWEDRPEVVHALPDSENIAGWSVRIIDMDTDLPVDGYVKELHTREGWITIYEKDADGNIFVRNGDRSPAMKTVKGQFKLQKDIQDYG